MHAGASVEADAADVLALKGRGRVSCVARTVSSAICQGLLLWSGVPQWALLGQGGLGKGRESKFQSYMGE